VKVTRIVGQRKGPYGMLLVLSRPGTAHASHSVIATYREDTMTEAHTPTNDAGSRLYSAVDSLVATNEFLMSEVDLHRGRVQRCGFDTEAAWRTEVAEQLVRTFARRSAFSGGATALPAIMPGVGTAIAVGGALADVTLILKYEVEMALALAWHYGFDIRQPNERQLAFLLASVQSYDRPSGGSAVGDAISIEASAIWNYAPRRIGKAIATVLGAIALRAASRSALRLIPFVGVAVGAGMNRALTLRTGRACAVELAARRAAVDTGK